MNEHEIIKDIRRIFRQGKGIVKGPGDDCAVIRTASDSFLLFAADQLVEGIHYLKTSGPEKTAAKLLKRNISDIAAMGGLPSEALVTAAVPGKTFEWFRNFSRALEAEARKWDISVCGGDISSVPEGSADVFTLSILGYVEPEKLCLRSNAGPGQLLYCTGCFGNSFSSEHHMNFEPRIPEARFIAGSFTNAAIDVSDGLLADLIHLAEESACCVFIDCAAIPLREGASPENALSDGEDYELLFSVDEERASALEETWPFETPLTRIGHFAPGNPGKVFDSRDKKPIQISGKGFDHFNA